MGHFNAEETTLCDRMDAPVTSCDWWWNGYRKGKLDGMRHAAEIRASRPRALRITIGLTRISISFGKGD